MCHAFNGIGQTLRKIIHRIYAPFVAGHLMCHMTDSINDRISHVKVGRSHIELGAKNVRAILKFSCPHAFKEIQIFLDGTIPIWAVLTRFGQRAAMASNFIGTQTIYVRLAHFY